MYLKYLNGQLPVYRRFKAGVIGFILSSLKVSNRDPDTTTATPSARRTLSLTDESFSFEGIPLTPGIVSSSQGLGTENNSGVAGEGMFIADFNPVSVQ